jgi:glycogen operon protein
MSEEDWQVGYAKSLGVFLHGAAIQRPGEHGERVKDDSFYVIFNAHHEPLPFALPPQQFGAHWMRVLDTSTDALPELRRSKRAQQLQAGEQIDVQSRSVVVLRCLD